MASNYPDSLDDFENPTPGRAPISKLSEPPHSLQHGDANDAIEALQAKLGIGASPAADAATGYVPTKQADGTTKWTETPITAHATDATDVHGIADTAVLETQAGAQVKADGAVSGHEAAQHAGGGGASVFPQGLNSLLRPFGYWTALKANVPAEGFGLLDPITESGGSAYLNVVAPFEWAVEYATTATAGNGKTFRTGEYSAKMGQSPIFLAKVQFDVFTNVRCFIGFNWDTDGADSDNVSGGTIGHLGFQFSTPRGDVNWKFTGHATGQPQQVVDSGVAPVADKAYWFRIAVDWPAATAVLELRDTDFDTVLASRTFTDPNHIGQANRDKHVMASLQTQAAEVKKMRMYRMALEHQLLV